MRSGVFIIPAAYPQCFIWVSFGVLNRAIGHATIRDNEQRNQRKNADSLHGDKSDTLLQIETQNVQAENTKMQIMPRLKPAVRAIMSIQTPSSKATNPNGLLAQRLPRKTE